MSRDRSPPSAEKGVIRFYSVSAEYGELSNFALYPITLKGKRWPTSEHYFQAQKFVTTPMLAARWGRDRKRKLRRDWERIFSGGLTLLRHVRGRWVPA
jgi:predicted NAD-dependent protein-ADP-ribosyltransferase YbiA (DUF1768 family)